MRGGDATSKVLVDEASNAREEGRKGERREDSCLKYLCTPQLKFLVLPLQNSIVRKYTKYVILCLLSKLFAIEIWFWGLRFWGFAMHVLRYPKLASGLYQLKWANSELHIDQNFRIDWSHMFWYVLAVLNCNFLKLWTPLSWFLNPLWVMTFLRSFCSL